MNRPIPKGLSGIWSLPQFITFRAPKAIADWAYHIMQHGIVLSRPDLYPHLLIPLWALTFGANR